MNKIFKSSLALVACASCVYASGYRIPEQSFASTAKSGANIANTNGADASYYNPANMAFMDDKSYLESAFTYINLPSIDYTDSQSSALNSSSKIEHFLAPAFHYVSPKITEDLRFGVSFTAPGGLAKRWDDVYARATAEKFALKILELSPSMSYAISEQLAIGLGVRMTYIEGEVKSDATRNIGTTAMRFYRELEGDSIDFGYNLALTYKPTNALTIATTYRSNVDLSLKGDATLIGGVANYIGDASITIPLPAVFDLAVSYDFGKTVVELVYERTFWSKYKALDFNYAQDLTANPLLANFDTPLTRDWSDVNCYRIGITHELTDELTLLAGFAYDESPTNSEHFGFELPDTNAKLYSLGASYKINQDMTLALGYLYDQKDSKSVNNRTATDTTAINGEFKNASAHLVTMSFMYEF